MNARPTGRFRAVILSLLLCVVSPFARTAVQVSRVEPGESCDLAGIRPGDILYDWKVVSSGTKDSQTGVMGSTIDLIRVEHNQGSISTVLCRFSREGEMSEAEIPAGPWGIEARPVLPADVNSLFLEEMERVGDGDVGEILSLWETRSDRAFEEGHVHLASWWGWMCSDIMVQNNERERAITFLDALSARIPDTYPCVRSLTQMRKAQILDRMDSFIEAAENYLAASRSWKTCEGPDLVSARLCFNAGMMHHYRGDLDSAETMYAESYQTAESWTSASLTSARVLTYLGILAIDRDDFTRAESFYRQALGIQRQLAPERLQLSLTLNALGNLEWRRGNYAKAEEYHKEALSIRHRLAPGSKYEGQSLNNLGLIARARGFLDRAEQYYLKALELNEKTRPGSSSVSIVCNNLGNLYETRGENDKAREYLIRNLKIRETISPERMDHARALINLGQLELDDQNPDLAEEYALRAQEILRKTEPKTILMAQTYLLRADIFQSLEEYDSAIQESLSAMSLLEEIAPGTHYASRSYYIYGCLQYSKGNLKESEIFLLRALRIIEKVAPNSEHESSLLYYLGRIARQKGDMESAESYHAGAVESLEAQEMRLGGGEHVRNIFSANNVDIYREYLNFLVDTGKEDMAFHTLERYRARNLLSIISQRDILFSLDVPENLLAKKRELNFRYDKLQAQLADMSIATDSESIEEILTEMRHVRESRITLNRQIRDMAPGLDALQNPEPVTLSEMKTVLEPDTLFLSYSVGHERILIFAISSEKLIIKRSGMDPDDMEKTVRMLRMLSGNPDSSLSRIKELGKKLYSGLIEPIKEIISGKDRLMICPDGALYQLPFSVLTDPGDRYLAESYSIHYVISGTLYRETFTGTNTIAEPSLVAFGDPVYPAAVDDNMSEHTSRDVSDLNQLKALPGSREEVLNIASLFKGRVSLFLGKDALEENVKNLPERTTYLHFACHGSTDIRSPLDSGLVLTIPVDLKEGSDNGVLQAWEIFESVRVNARLVSLSACETAVGKNMGGEGIIGLTRAFIFAGARTVLSTLWKVSDRSTSKLMADFYREIMSGDSPDQALRKARLTYIHSEDPVLRHPFYWAPYILNGTCQ